MPALIDGPHFAIIAINEIYIRWHKEIEYQGIFLHCNL